eukprot:2006893-Rhodomonas_salina.5
MALQRRGQRAGRHRAAAQPHALDARADLECVQHLSAAAAPTERVREAPVLHRLRGCAEHVRHRQHAGVVEPVVREVELPERGAALEDRGQRRDARVADVVAVEVDPDERGERAHAGC